MRNITDEQLEELIIEHANTGDPLDKLIFEALIELKTFRFFYGTLGEETDNDESK